MLSSNACEFLLVSLLPPSFHSLFDTGTLRIVCIICSTFGSAPTWGLCVFADRYVLVGSRHSSWYEGGLADWSSGAAVISQIITSITAQTHARWQPDRTIVFCSMGGSALGNIGSFEWGEVRLSIFLSELLKSPHLNNCYVNIRNVWCAIHTYGYMIFWSSLNQ